MKRVFIGVMVGVMVACGGDRPPRPEPPPQMATFAVVATNQDGRVLEGAAFDVSALPEVPDAFTNADGYASVQVPTGMVFAAQLTLEGHDPWWAEVSLSGNLQIQVMLRSWSPPPPPPSSGRLRIEGDCFVDDGGCVLPLYAHSGDLFSKYVRDPGMALAQLDHMVNAGYRGARVWSTLGCEGGACDDPGDYWYGREVGPQVTPDYWQKVDEFFREVQRRGLFLVWSQGDVRALGDRREAMRRFAELDGGVIDWIDCGNEAYQTGEPDPQKLAECVGFYQEAGGRGLKTLTDAPIYSGGSFDAWSLPPADAFDVHSFRGGHSWDKRRHAWGYTYENPPKLRFGINSEPPGNGARVSVTANKHELDDEAVTLLAAGSLLGRMAHVWFSGEGVILERGLEGESGFWAVPRLREMLPPDVMTYPTSHHSGSSWASIRVLEPTGEVRIDGRQHPDGRFAYTIDGPAGNYSLRVMRGFEGRICDPGSGACSDVSKNTGERLELSFNRGRIFTGRIR